ncbi:MAG: hypothetical protein O3C40_30030 [Planctomycetota bacterium]|nr:hypothetical protein [Planctomycetota bacterium]
MYTTNSTLDSCQSPKATLDDRCGARARVKAGVALHQFHSYFLDLLGGWNGRDSLHVGDGRRGAGGGNFAAEEAAPHRVLRTLFRAQLANNKACRRAATEFGLSQVDQLSAADFGQ